MTIEQLDKVDIITHNDDNVILVISDHLEWDDKNEKLLLLQEKLNLYLSFIESGDVYEQYPTARGKRFELRIVSKYKPTAEATHFMSIISKIVSEAGFDFQHKWH